MLISLLHTLGTVCAVLGCAAGLFLWGFALGMRQGPLEVTIEVSAGDACLWTRLPQEEGTLLPVLPPAPETTWVRERRR